MEWSDDDLVYLRPDVALEPLVNHYCAWLHLISPATAALNFTKFTAPLLRSFVKSPQLHRSSAADPRLRGGMFVDLDDSALDDVLDLERGLTDPESATARLAAEMDELTSSLRSADGYDLTPRYEDVPAGLRGHAELVYDLEDHARVRLNERLLYRTYFDESQHSVDLWPCTGDERPFAMTTPRFRRPGHVQLRIPLGDRRIDDLFAAQSVPCRFGDLVGRFGIDDQDRASFAGLFAAERAPAPVDRGGPADEMRVRYFGHACLVVQHGDTTIMTDPFIADYPAAGRYSHQDLPDRIDWVVITHGHHDHLELGTLLKLRHKIGTIVVPRTDSGALQDPSLKLCLEALGFRNVIAAEAGDIIEAGDGRIMACPFVGEHCDLDIGAKATYVVGFQDRAIYVGADSRGVDEQVFALTRELAGPIDMAFLGMECDGAPLHWLYGPLYSRRLDHKKSRSRKLNGSDATEAARVIRGLGVREAYVYAMGREPWLVYIMATSYTEDSYQLQQIRKFVEECAAADIKAGDLLGQAEFRLPVKRETSYE